MGRARIALVMVLFGCGGGELPWGLSEKVMDRTADPCVDFYQYACGGFLTQHETGRTFWYSRLDPAVSATERAVEKILSQTRSSDPRIVLLDQYLDACVGAVDSSDHSHLGRLLGKIDAITPDAGLAPAVAALHSAGAEALFGLDTAPDALQPRRRVVELYEAGISLPDRYFYVSADAPPSWTPTGDTSRRCPRCWGSPMASSHAPSSPSRPSWPARCRPQARPATPA